MRILVIAPRDAAATLAAPLQSLGHTVAALASDAGPLPPPVPDGVAGHTKGRWLRAVRSLEPEALLTVVADAGGEGLSLRVRGALRMGDPDPEEHAVPRDLLADPDALLELLAALLPPAVPPELSQWLSGAQEDAEADTTDPAPRRTRKRARVEQED